MAVTPVLPGQQVHALPVSSGTENTVPAVVFPEVLAPATPQILSVENVFAVQAGDTPGQFLLGEKKASSTIFAGGMRGPRGLPGESEAYVVFLVAGEILGGHRAVYFDGLVVRYADAQDLSKHPVVGITEHAALPGELVRIRRQGLLTGFPGSYEPGTLFLGTNGLVSQSVPEQGVVVQLGQWLGNSTLDVSPLFMFFLE